MSTEVKLPELGENVTSGDLLKLLVKVGDKIQKDQAVMELETDKAAIEVPSPIGGTVQQVHVKEGEKVKVGQLILSVEENGTGAAKGAARESAEGGVAQGATPPPAEEKVQQPPSKAVSAGPVQPTPPPKKESKPAQTQLVEFKLPELGENISAGDLLSVMVKVGDKVEINQPVVELETDKATIEVPSTVAGTVTSVLVKPGQKLTVGTAIFTAESAGGEPQGAEVAAETDTGGIGTGGQLPQEQPIGATTQETIERTPAPQPIPRAETAPKASWEDESAPPPAPEVPEQISGRTGKSPADVPAGPAVRALAREIGVDITEVKGSGPRGRVTPKDVKDHARRSAQEYERGMVSGGRMVAAAPLPDFAKWGTVERKPMAAVRRKTAEHMAQAWSIPHVTNNDKADITALDQLRKSYSKRAEAAGGKLTMTAIALKIVAAAIKQFPQFAASIDLGKEEIVYKSYTHIGVAVDTERGLLVPVIRDVDRKNIIELAVELQQVAQKARDRKLSMDDMQGGVFTITNLGGIGGTSFTPIINAPEVAILGMMRSAMEPVYIDGKFEPRLMLPLSLSYDHRLIDGADAARFLRWVCEAFEQPFLLSLQG
ncbi:MAG TPA: 2-oxo acid dehydrogenase subunit E2 [Terriglobales bacterium]|nr:2-oxo acid dehydrogenase subunit E2 [Terriglobales bacterium]